MKKNIVKTVLISLLALYLCSHTLTLVYTAPPCYRIDFSVALLAFLAVYVFDLDERTLVAFGIKELLTLFLGNPGIAFPWHLLLTMSNALMEAAMLVAVWFVFKAEDKKFQKVVLMTGMYSMLCVAMNIVYHARICAASYGANLSAFIEDAKRFCIGVNGYWSLMFRSLGMFYFIQFLVIIGMTVLFRRIFLGKEEDAYAIDGIKK